MTAMNRLIATCIVIGGLLAGLPARAQDTGKPPIIVFGAASLTNVLQDLGDAFTKQSAIPVKFSFAASSTLARQIESGAPADVFFSADLDWMDYLQTRNLIQRATRRDVVGNRLVLIAPGDSAIELKIGPHFALVRRRSTANVWRQGIPIRCRRAGMREPRSRVSECGTRSRIGSSARTACAPPWRSSIEARRRSASCTKPMR